MFDRFIRLAKAKKALRDQRFEDALQLATDPLIKSDRRAEEVLAAAKKRILDRARMRLVAGDPGAARHDLQRLRGAGDDPELASLAAAIDAAEADATAAVGIVRKRLDEARRLLGNGECADAEVLLAGAQGSALELERQQLLQRLAEARRRAGEHIERAKDLLRSQATDDAVAEFARAAALSHDVAAVADVRLPLFKAAAEAAQRRIQDRLEAGDLLGAVSRHREAITVLPALHRAEAFRPVDAALQAALLEAFRGMPDMASAVPLARAVRAAKLEASEPLASLVDGLLSMDAAPFAEEIQAVRDMQRVARGAGAARLAADANARMQRDQAHHDQLAEARARLAAGELELARALLTRVLQDAPLHEGARRDLDLVDQGMAELDQRLAVARTAARAGRLREACAIALALAGGGRIAADAQVLVQDVRARMAVVDRGLDEVRLALHGRSAATVEGVRHCLRRLEELAKVQCDHEELPVVTAAVSAEIEALEACEKVEAACERNACAEAATGLGELFTAREKLLVSDRLDARLFHLLDRVTQEAERCLVHGRLTDVDLVAEVLGRFAVLRREFAERGERLREARRLRQEAAAALVGDAETRLAAGDLAEAEQLAEQALQQWAESSAARALAERLRDLRRQSDALARVAVLAKERDFQGAQQKLAEMPPTPALLRTRIFDMKQSLMRAQGLEGAFLLRIDEGGEHLVVRGETVSIGNVRQTRSDLPVLANIAGRHASIRRSMSFHGGMQDTIVAEEGEVRVAGQVVPKRALVPGDRVQLGPSLALVYQQPCSRSLSTGFVLQGGFQVGGTDRVLLMKDRGRDGRLLIGPGRDVHVRVPSATGEVEIFATSAGQMRVACDAGGEIDGVAFRGDHPVAAGQVVCAGGVTFVLLPWRPGS